MATYTGSDSGSYRHYPISGSEFGALVNWSTQYDTTAKTVTVTQQVFLKYTGSINTGSEQILTYAKIGNSDAGQTLLWHGTLVDTTATGEYKTVLLRTDFTSVNLVETSSGSKIYQLPDGTSIEAFAQIMTQSGGVPYNNLRYNLNAPNGDGITNPEIIQISGMDLNPPTVTVNVTNITTTTATVTVTSNKPSNVFTVQYGSNYNAQMEPSGVYSKTFLLTSLTPGTSYTVQCSATSYPEGVSSSDVSATFTTQAATPATLTAVVNSSDIYRDAVIVNVSSNVTCNNWMYKVDNGVWHTVSSSATTAQRITITGLARNTQYSVTVKATRVDNNVESTSNVCTFTTPGKTTFQSGYTSYSLRYGTEHSFTIFVNTAPVYSQSAQADTHTLALANGNQSTTLASNFTVSGDSYTVNLSQANENWILGQLGNSKSLTFDLSLATGSYGTDAGTLAVTISDDSGIAPTFTNFTYQDTNTVSTAITGGGSNPVLIAGYSTVVVSATAATPAAGASISSYTASFGNKTASSSTTTINLGRITNSGTAPLTVTASDTRDYATSVSRQVTSLPYSKPRFTDSSFSGTVSSLSVSWDGNDILVNVYGSVQSLIVSNTEKNSPQMLEYQVRRSDQINWSTAVEITGLTISGLNFSKSFRILESLLDTDPGTTSKDYTWFVRAIAYDKLGYSELEGTVLADTPLVSFRTGKVGINNKNPSSALDVIGNIEMNGFNVQGFVRTVSSIETNGLNAITDAGIYLADWDSSSTLSSSNFPIPADGVLEVLPELTGLVQRFTVVPTDGRVWIRHGSYSGYSWSFNNWYQLSGGGAFTQVQTDWNQADSDAVDYIKNKPFQTVDTTVTQGSTNPVEGGAVYTAIEQAKSESGIYLVAEDSRAGSTTSAQRSSTRWMCEYSGMPDLYSGLAIKLKIDIAALSSYGATIIINDGVEHAVLRNGATNMSNIYDAGTIFELVYDADATATVYTGNPNAAVGASTTNPVTDGATVSGYTDFKIGDIVTYNNRRYMLTHQDLNVAANWIIMSTTSTTKYTSYTCQGCWKLADAYSANSNTVPTAYSTTAAGTAAKAATCTNFVLQPNSYLIYLTSTTNTAGPITLNVNSTGAIPVYINGEASSATNNTLPAGMYIAFYDGTAYQFRNDGKIPGKIMAAVNADQVPWSGIQNRPTLSHVYVEPNTTDYILIVDDI